MSGKHAPQMMNSGPARHRSNTHIATLPSLTHGSLSAGKFVRFYYAHQFVPLIVFFFMFLAIIKNKRLHHFVRFNGMQAMMLDILVMLPTISNNYIPGEIFWTVLGKFITSTCFIAVFVAIAYSVVFTMAGKYADIPLVSDACYMQVYQIEFL
jgi:hypothetical protein